MKNIIGLIPTMQSIALVNENLKIATKKKVKTKDLVGLGMKNIVGTSLIKVESDLISGL
jgi:hypothetical protein